MKDVFQKSFLRDLKRVKEQRLREAIQNAIEQVEAARDPQKIGGLKKVSGTEDYFRIRVGDFRPGVFIHQDTVTFARCQHRRDFYRELP